MLWTVEIEKFTDSKSESNAYPSDAWIKLWVPLSVFETRLVRKARRFADAARNLI